MSQGLCSSGYVAVAMSQWQQCYVCHSGYVYVLCSGYVAKAMSTMSQAMLRGAAGYVAEAMSQRLCASNSSY